MRNRIILFEKRPFGKVTDDCFRLIDMAVPQPVDGEVLLKTLYVSVDPYLRGRMSNVRSYTAPYKTGEPMRSGLVAEVIESKHPDFEVGEFVAARMNWAEYQVSNGEGLLKVDPNVAPLSAYQGVLGMPGLTAYLGLTEIGRPQPGETLVVSGAAGAVGSTAGQIGKIMGCRVIGIAGSEEKIQILKTEFGFDEAVNYKTTTRMYKTISKMCPDGVDIYFDNVGGDISDGVVMNIRKFARVIVCGNISQLNETRIPMGPRLQPSLLVNSATMKGFIVRDYAGKFPDAAKQLTHWFTEGKLKYRETIVEGFENIPKAFMGLFEGANIGKMMVKV